MSLSLGLVVVFVLVTVAFLGGSLGILRADPNARDVRPVDFRPELAQAVSTADYEVLAPVDVPDDWVSQSARAVPAGVDGGSTLLQIGFLTPSRRYATLIQSDGDPAAVLDAQRLEPVAESTVDVAGETWQSHRRVDRDEVALVRTDPDRTVIVTGDAVLDELSRLAAGLGPADQVPDSNDGADGFAPIR